MPVTPTYPGVYIEELPSGVRPIVGVATSITAFIGRALRGKTDSPVRIQSFGDFDRKFGGLWSESTLSYAVQHFFQHGGSDALIIRVHKDAGTAQISLPGPDGALTLEAASPGEWGNALRVSVNYNSLLSPGRYTLRIQELESFGSTTIVSTEEFVNLSNATTDSRYVETVINEESELVQVTGTVPGTGPTSTISVPGDLDDAANYLVPGVLISDGDVIADAQITDPSLESGRKGMYALEEADLFNLLYIPPLQFDDDGDTDLARAAEYCQSRRAVLIVDPPEDWDDVDDAETGIATLRSTIGTSLADHATVYFPRIRMANPLKENRTQTFAPGGAIAGIIARTDAERGVWKAPAGIEASFSGVREFTYKMTDGENGRLNPLGLNCLRNFRAYGNVVWGARTMAGADQLSSQWKYLPVRRMALYIEESLYRGLHWVVFEPNDESLWAQIRLNAGTFMQDLFRQGAFQGKTPREAYLVKCDSETTTQSDIDKGIVNVLIGFAPLKPAEFVIIQIQQLTKEATT